MIDHASSRTRRSTAVSKYPWLRAVYHQQWIRQEIARDSEVLADPRLTSGEGTSRIDGPDFLIGRSTAIDVVPDCDASRQGHLERDYITSPEQLMPYAVPTDEFLAEAFRD
jgi:hypothetical protein